MNTTENCSSKEEGVERLVTMAPKNKSRMRSPPPPQQRKEKPKNVRKSAQSCCLLVLWSLHTLQRKLRAQPKKEGKEVKKEEGAHTSELWPPSGPWSVWQGSFAGLVDFWARAVRVPSSGTWNAPVISGPYIGTLKWLIGDNLRKIRELLNRKSDFSSDFVTFEGKEFKFNWIILKIVTWWRNCHRRN